MKSAWFLSLLAAGLLSACSNDKQPTETTNELKSAPQEHVLAGAWIMEAAGGVMLDPQTSGLTHVDGMLTLFPMAALKSISAAVYTKSILPVQPWRRARTIWVWQAVFAAAVSLSIWQMSLT